MTKLRRRMVWWLLRLAFTASPDSGRTAVGGKTQSSELSDGRLRLPVSLSPGGTGRDPA